MTFNEVVVHLTHMFMMMTINCDPNYQILLVETFSKKNQPIYSQSVQIRTIFFTRRIIFHISVFQGNERELQTRTETQNKRVS